VLMPAVAAGRLHRRYRRSPLSPPPLQRPPSRRRRSPPSAHARRIRLAPPHVALLPPPALDLGRSSLLRAAAASFTTPPDSPVAGDRDVAPSPAEESRGRRAHRRRIHHARAGERPRRCAAGVGSSSRRRGGELRRFHRGPCSIRRSTAAPGLWGGELEEEGRHLPSAASPRCRRTA
jgi:hypothetical protein